jgi:hypothetical protein
MIIQINSCSWELFGLNNNGRLIVASKNAPNLLALKILKNNGGHNNRPLAIAHLPILIIPPLHNIANIKQGNTMTLATLQLFNPHLLILALNLQYIIR